MAGEQQFISTHKLDFYSTDSSEYDLFNQGHMDFKVGSCDGVWGCTDDSYYILAISNRQPGNGHLDDVFEWFEHAAKRDGRNLIVLKCMNERFYRHLVEKKGFIKLDTARDNCIKIFNKRMYKKLLKNGNKMLIKGTMECT